MTQHSLSPKLERDRFRHDTRRVEEAWASWYRSPIWKSSEGTGSPKSPSAVNVLLRVEPYPRATLITSNPTGLSGRVSCNTRTHKAYVFVTTTLIGIKRDVAMRLGFQDR